MAGFWRDFGPPSSPGRVPTDRSTALYEHGSTRVRSLDGPVYLLDCDLSGRPERTNLSALESALELVRRDAPRVAVVHARSDCESDASSSRDAELRRIADCATSLASITSPTIGAVSGGASPVTSTLALHCDLRVGAESTDWRIPAADAIPGSTTETRIRRSLAEEASTASLRRDSPLSATRLRELGLLNAVIEPTAVRPSAVGFASRLSHASGVALRWADRAIEATALPDSGRAPPPRPATSSTTDGRPAERRQPPEFETVALDEFGDGAYEIALDRPASLNAMTPRTIDELHAALDWVERTDVRGVRLTSTGRRAFSIGFDVDALGAGDDAVEIGRSCQRLTRRLAALPVPTVACVEGYCLGGGLEIVMAADAQVATRGSEFGLPEIRRGLIPAGGGTQLLSGLAGVAKAKELIFTGRHFDASLAEAWGIVDEVVDQPRLERRATAALDALRGSEVDSYGRSRRLRGTVTGYALERIGLRRGVEKRTRTD